MGYDGTQGFNFGITAKNLNKITELPKIKESLRTIESKKPIEQIKTEKNI